MPRAGVVGSQMAQGKRAYMTAAECLFNIVCIACYSLTRIAYMTKFATLVPTSQWLSWHGTIPKHFQFERPLALADGSRACTEAAASMAFAKFGEVRH